MISVEVNQATIGLIGNRVESMNPLVGEHYACFSLDE
jgi:hypothetical protein